MMRLTDEICGFMKEAGFECSVQILCGMDVVCVALKERIRNRLILPLEMEAYTLIQAQSQAENAEECIRLSVSHDGEYPLIVTRDRWERQKEMMQKRLLAHMEVFLPIYARNCEVRKIDKATAREFLERNHSYGHAACRYCYGLFFRRHTGHIARRMTGQDVRDGMEGTLVAVATFSNARTWIKGGRSIRSYEWTRYASLPDVRISGGMGRLLKAFIREVGPDDIMSYADLEWSEGNVYEELGFRLEGKKGPVVFLVDELWRRFPVKPGMTGEEPGMTGEEMGMTGEEMGMTGEEMGMTGEEMGMTGEEMGRVFLNFGSNKYRLKLTDYE